MFWEVVDERAERLGGMEMTEDTALPFSPTYNNFRDFLDDLDYVLHGPFSSVRGRILLLPDDDPARATQGIVLLRREADGRQYGLRLHVSLAAIMVARRADLDQAKAFLEPYHRFHEAVQTLLNRIHDPDDGGQLD